MDKETILKKIKPFLINNAEITEENFELIFSDFSQKEKYSICEVLESENIEIVYEEEIEENRVSEEIPSFDENLILDRVIPLLTSKDEIYELDFENLFQDLSQKEKYEVLEILEKNKIALVFEKYQERKNEDTINFDFVFQKISPYITKNNWILKSKFNEVFSFLSELELEKINDYIFEKGIRVVEEHDFENAEIIYNYIEEDKEYSKLSIEMLCGLYQKGNKVVLKDIYKKTEKLIYSRSMHFIKYFNHNLSIEDLLQYGYLGLHKAIKSYDSSYDTTFSTHAVQWIDQQIRRNIMDNGFLIRIPVHAFEEIRKTLKLSKELEIDDLDNLINSINLIEGEYDIEKISNSIKIISSLLNLQSLNIKVGNEDSYELSDIISGDSRWDPEELTDKELLKDEIFEILKELKPNYKEILCYRFGLCNYPEKTLEEIGKMFKVTRERIRQIEKKALNKFKKNNKTKKLKIYLEDN